MTALEKAIEAITEQQSKMEKDSTPYFVGEQLKDILRSAPPSAAEIVLQDLGTKGMSVEDCEKKIAKQNGITQWPAMPIRFRKPMPPGSSTIWMRTTATYGSVRRHSPVRSTTLVRSL